MDYLSVRYACHKLLFQGKKFSIRPSELLLASFIFQNEGKCKV